jgi:F420H(2)-dependent quinone reductase
MTHADHATEQLLEDRIQLLDMVLVAVNSGQPTRNPDWYYNLKATPIVRVEVLNRCLQAAPGYANWKRAANRTIPMVRLVALDQRDEDRPWC